MMKNDYGRKRVSVLVEVRTGVQVYERFCLSSILIILTIDSALDTIWRSTGTRQCIETGDFLMKVQVLVPG
jgi:hypothetical protein